MIGTVQLTMRNGSTEIETRISDLITTLLVARRNYQQEIKVLTQQYCYVVFYGCGTVFRKIVDTVWRRYIGTHIHYCCDSNPEKWGKTFCGIRCISPSELRSIKDTSVVFIVVGEFKPIFEYLAQNAFPSINLFYKYDVVSSSFLAHLADKELAEIAANLFTTRQLLSDGQSIRVFDAILNRILAPRTDPYIMLHLCEPNQYFPADIIRLSDREGFVDIGAFTGDTVKEFIQRTNGRFDRIFSFELDQDNFCSLQKNVKGMLERDRIAVFNLGIWDAECQTAYSIANSDSTIGEGDGRGRLAPLDKVLQNEKVSFIKMDIEGSETNALRGARHIIQTQKPQLAVCVYHHIRDLWEVPRLIKDLVPEYRIYLRHHGNLEYETVCYAVI